jgi:acid stress chaperone HdeB
MLWRVAIAVLVVAGSLAAQPGNAQLVDLSTLRCKQFIELPKETVNAVTMWLDGHLTDEEDPAVVDFDKMNLKAERLAAYCGQNPEMSLMTAAENTMSK